MDKLELKRIKSVGKERVVKERAKGWEDVNSEGAVKKSKKKKVDDGEEARKESEWVSDEDMEQEGAEPRGSAGQENTGVVPQSVPLPAAAEDEML